ncbi:MAG: peptidoglycan bridge formation glycyltransferase FemA/FemB family protein, partial [Ktedonobacteraceae bacterium]|nr:peptidoglycan bridge formation glycyltransferase FemA/FemB family protein [Ktedonobacteraceae bacterium]
MSAQNQRYILRAVAEEQRTLWDEWMNAQPGGHLLQSWTWGELKSESGWHPLRLALWDDERTEIVAAAQVLRRSAPRMPLRLGHLAYIPKGPVIDWSRADLCTTFFSQLDQCLRRQGALALRMELNFETGTQAGELVMKRMQELSTRPERTIQPLRTIIVDLEPDEDAILARMKEKWRYNIGLARRRGVTVRVAETEQDVRSWYALLQVTSERETFGVHTLDYYLDCWRLLSRQQQARLFLAEYEGQLLAGIFVSLFAREGIYLYGASSNELRKHMPNHLLQWEAMTWAKRNGATSYDLWGIPPTDDDDESMAGVYRFKSGWGGRVVRFLGCYERVYQPLAMSLARH